MASGNQIKSLIKSYQERDDSRFFATAMQIAAKEAKKGNNKLASDLKGLINEAKSKKISSPPSQAVPIARPKGELNELLEVYYPDLTLEDMVLEESTKESLEKILNEQKNIDKILKYDLEPRRKLLLVGHPGCGKSMSAKAIAGELGLPIFIVRLDGLITKFMGESIAKLRLIFDSMNENRGVYLFDEFDSIGTTRGYSNDVGEIKRVLNSFLLNIENDRSNSLIIAATNFKEALDKALFRRFDDIIQYNLPKDDQVKAIVENSLKSYAKDKQFNIEEIQPKAKGLSYADLVKACNDAKKEMLLSGNDKIRQEDILDSLSRRENIS